MSFFTSSAKKRQYLRPGSLLARTPSIVDRTISAVVDMVHDENIREGMLNRADLFRTCRNTYNSTIYQRVRHWTDRDYDGLGSLPGDQYSLIKKATAVSIINLLIITITISSNLIGQ